MSSRKFPNPGEAMEFLKGRIVERKAEESRRTFVQDHQLIHDRKKNEPCSPILPVHDQEAWFAKLESNGIWARVLGLITNPSDMTSAYFSCEMFRKHLEDRRKMALLPKVLKVFGDTGRIGLTESLKQRLVCKTGKKAVEDLVLSPFKSSSSSSPSSLPIWYPKNWDWKSPLVCEFNNVEDIELAMEKLHNGETSCASASLLRLMEVDDSDVAAADQDQEIFYSKLSEFLSIHGESVWGLRIIYHYSNYDKLCQIVSSMCNLKILKVFPHGNDDDDPDVVRDEIHESIVRHSFPFLPSLEFCYIGCCVGSTDILVVAILSKCLNLKAVHLEHSWFEDESNVIPEFVWNALRNLRLEYFYLEYDQWDDAVFMDAFLHVEQFDWPLKFLTIELYPSADNLLLLDNLHINIPSSAIVKLLNRYSASLIEYSFKAYENISFSLNLNDNDGEVLVMDCPRLKKINFPEVINNQE